MNKPKSITLFVLLCLIVQVVGSFWTKEGLFTWYPMIAKPSWTPPNWLFGPVWTILYIMIAIAGFLIYRSKKGEKRSQALLFYGIQLSLNFLWSFLFFSLQSPLLGLIDISLLALFIILTILYTWKVKRSASILLIPYFLWVLYAAGLNASIWFLNK